MPELDAGNFARKRNIGVGGKFLRKGEEKTKRARKRGPEADPQAGTEVEEVQKWDFLRMTDIA